MIHNAEFDEHRALVLAQLLHREFPSRIDLLEDGLNLGRRVILGIELLNAVVAQAATHALEEAMTRIERIQKRLAQIGRLDALKAPIQIRNYATDVNI